MRESGPRKRDEDGDVDEDDHCGDDPPPNGTLAPLRERRGSPPCASSSMASPWMGRGSPSGPWPFMVMMAPMGSSSIASGDEGPLRQVPERA